MADGVCEPEGEPRFWAYEQVSVWRSSQTGQVKRITQRMSMRPIRFAPSPHDQTTPGRVTLTIKD